MGKIVLYYFADELRYNVLTKSKTTETSVYTAKLYDCPCLKEKIPVGLYSENFVSVQSEDNNKAYYDTSQGTLFLDGGSLMFLYSELWTEGLKNYECKIVSGTGEYINSKGYIIFNDTELKDSPYASIEIILC